MIASSSLSALVRHLRIGKRPFFSKGALQGLLELHISQMTFPTDNTRGHRPVDNTWEVLERSFPEHVSYVNTLSDSFQ